MREGREEGRSGVREGRVRRRGREGTHRRRGRRGGGRRGGGERQVRDSREEGRKEGGGKGEGRGNSCQERGQPSHYNNVSGCRWEEGEGEV